MKDASAVDHDKKLSLKDLNLHITDQRHVEKVHKNVHTAHICVHASTTHKKSTYMILEWGIDRLWRLERGFRFRPIPNHHSGFLFQSQCCMNDEGVCIHQEWNTVGKMQAILTGARCVRNWGTGFLGVCRMSSVV